LPGTVELGRQLHFDIILMDREKPVVGGLFGTERIEALKGGSTARQGPMVGRSW
jgi:hypothetical protein